MTEFTVLEIIAIVLLTIITLKLTLSVFRGLWTCFLGNVLGFGIQWKTGDNVWAVITGATDGIGLEYAKQLAQKGYNLVIISRSEDKLKTTKDYLIENYKKCQKVKTIAVDFKNTDIYDKLSEELNGLEVIDVLVNNVGTLSRCPEYFTEMDTKMNDIYINVNVISCLKLIEIVLPKMVTQRRGVVINISSQSAISAIPLMTTYSATKAFVNFVSIGLSFEYSAKGITVQTVMPSITNTNLMFDSFKSSFFMISAEQCVRSSLNSVGIESITFGHWKHKLMAYFQTSILFLFGYALVAKVALKVMIRRRDDFYRNVNKKV